jgi:hypothetical protein
MKDKVGTFVLPDTRLLKATTIKTLVVNKNREMY